MGCLQCEELRAQLGKAERSATELKTECRQQKKDLEFQEAELASLKQTMAQQVDELVRLSCACVGRRTVLPVPGVPSMLLSDTCAAQRALLGSWRWRR